ncbi:YceI family protein [Aureibacter tunicatorum]|uniref:Polyisoprenoid-binding protein YceI n=1 Tax=Aureibacter tunicatorum TaxID=866807 RepID=A0AAE4BS14_9BACT|nr:YceI family protein [Aureibacter tunicatorum]MDR6239276.1 polyisoprenoid-binding protein YceI [Aureibacter tunicatorum]BDD04799.1 hypothetical protein AUTU_22820 [Aureibacter tunicatorum]
MKRIIYPAIALAIGFANFSCENKTKEKQETIKEEVIESANDATINSSVLKLDENSIEVNWTAFKTTEKVGVKGKFDQIKVSNLNASETATDCINGIEFEILTASTNSGLEIRDNKITEFFFGKMANTESIKGKVISIDENGNATVSLTLNDVTKETTATVNIEDNTATMTGTINLDEWNGQEAVKSLNEKCEGLHKGSDGITKLWPDVSFEIKGKLAPQKIG